jgi:hypothetical protein
MAERIEHKHRDICIKRRAVVGHAVVLAVHRAGGRAQAAAAGVFKALAGLKRGLLADHTWAFDFFRHAVGIVDIPSARDELGGDVTGVGDGDGVGEAKHPHAWRGLRGQIFRAYSNGELRARHVAMLACCATEPISLGEFLATAAWHQRTWCASDPEKYLLHAARYHPRSLRNAA